jgi:hypothetical protein
MTGAGRARANKIRLPYPHPGQVAVRSQAKRFNWLSAGRRWRKTTLGMAVIVEAAVRGGLYFWGAPTFSQVRVGWNEARAACGDYADFNYSRMEVIFPSGGQVVYRSLDNPDNARGFTIDGAVIDEVGDVKASAWYEVLRPTLIDTNGWAWMIGTPRGRNWFWREHRGALDRDDSACWQVPTLGCEVAEAGLVRRPHPMENPDIPFSEVENLYNTLPLAIFKQEILAEFIEGEGAVFRNLAACLGAPLDAKPDDHEGHYVVMGVDWGKHQDFTAISVGCADCKIELARDRFNQIDYAFQRGRLRVLADKWQPGVILAESNAMGEPIIEELQREGLPVQGFQTTASSKPPLIENLALAFERAEWQLQADPVWTAELEAYERTVSATTGRSSYGAPEGGHDDTVMARALMEWQAQRNKILISWF